MHHPLSRGPLYFLKYHKPPEWVFVYMNGDMKKNLKKGIQVFVHIYVDRCKLYERISPYTYIYIYIHIHARLLIVETYSKFVHTLLVLSLLIQGV